MCRSRDSPGHCHARGADRHPLQGVLTGVVPIREYFAPGNLFKIIGVRGMSKVLLNKFRVPHPRSAASRAGGAGSIPFRPDSRLWRTLARRSYKVDSTSLQWCRTMILAGNTLG